MIRHWQTQGSRNSCSSNIVRGANALQKQQLVALVNHWVPTDILACRRKAALATLQLYSMSRVGEILQLTTCDLIERNAGLDLLIRSAKNDDRFGRGQVKFLPAESDDGIQIKSIIKQFLHDALKVHY